MGHIKFDGVSNEIERRRALLVPTTMSDRGKQIIANMAAKLAPTQQNKVLVSAASGC
jgi:hypothetical protein